MVRSPTEIPEEPEFDFDFDFDGDYGRGRLRVPTALSARQHRIEQGVAAHFPAFAGPQLDGCTEARAGEDERVVFAFLAERIALAVGEQLRGERRRDLAAEPGFPAAREVYAHDEGAMAAREQLAEQHARLRVPERLEMLEPARARTRFVPFTHVREVHIAEDDTAHAVPHELVEATPERRLEIVIAGAELERRQAEHAHLMFDQRARRTVELDAATFRVVEVQRETHVVAGGQRAIERKH
jgi:hypothetical protein